MKNALFRSGLVLALAFFGCRSASAQAQPQPTPRTQNHIVLKAAKPTAGTKGKASIKADIPSKDISAPKSRGETCQMSIVNHTGYHVKIYIDGKFNSMVGPWGRNMVVTDGLAPVIYCNTVGGSLEWNGGGECDLGVENVFDLKP